MDLQATFFKKRQAWFLYYGSRCLLEVYNALSMPTVGSFKFPAWFWWLGAALNGGIAVWWQIRKEPKWKEEDLPGRPA